MLTRNEFSKLALITGASSGIGKATAKLFAKKGFDLIITGRRQERLDELSLKLTNKYGVSVNVLSFDIRNRQETEMAIDSLHGNWIKINVLVNNAGLASGFSPIHQGDIDVWETMIDTNLKGLLYITRKVSPIMVENGSGHIINVCSTAGHDVYPNGNVYSATKFGVDALTKSMRIDLLGTNVKVSQVSPGHTEQTEFALVRFHGDAFKAQIYRDFVPLTSKDVADAIYYMASRPKHVSIQDIIITGTQQANSNFIDRSGRDD